MANIIGGVLRWYPGSERWGYYPLLAGQICCAVALGFMDISAPKLAANWFPPHQRTTATGIGAGPIFLAILVGYLSAPALVKVGSDLQFYMFVQGAFALTIGVLNIVLFRSAPPKPPSLSAGEEKMELIASFKLLLKDKNFLLILTTFCIGGGGAIVFTVEFPEMVIPYGYTDVNRKHKKGFFFSFSEIQNKKKKE